MIKNHSDLETSLRDSSPDIYHMDHQYSQRRMPLKIPDMLGSTNPGNPKEDEKVEDNVSTVAKNSVKSVESLSSPKLQKISKMPKDKRSKKNKPENNQNISSNDRLSSEEVTEDDLLLAASALEKLKSDNSIRVGTSLSNSPSPVPSSPPPLKQELSTSTLKPTIFDKMISHPLISNSINYVLEKTINTSTSHILPQNNQKEHISALSKSSNSPLTYNINNKNINSSMDKIPSTNDDLRKKRKRDLAQLDILGNKRTKPNTIPISSHAPPMSNLKRKQNPNLRQQVAISSAMSAQKSLQDLKHLSSLNLNIESRKKLTMLIHFLKLGNTQLSERIDNLIQSVDKKRQKLVEKSILNKDTDDNNTSTMESRSNSEPDINIQQIKSDIVTTVKKIVNVVSKVSAQSLSEPARSNVRDALLKLPANWATMLNNESMFSMNIDDDYKPDDEYSDDSDSDEDDSINNENDEEIPTMTVNNQTIFKRPRKPSISRRLLSSLLKYRKTKGGEIEENKQKAKKWFREKIKDQIMHDSSGKVLILAQESLDMVNKIINFCNESLDKAEHWNTDRQHQHQLELLQRLQQINHPLKQTEGRDDAVETMIVKETDKTQVANQVPSVKEKEKLNKSNN